MDVQIRALYSVSFLQLIYNDLCPDLLKNLFDQCCSKVVKNRPTMSDVVKTLSVGRLDVLYCDAITLNIFGIKG